MNMKHKGQRPKLDRRNAIKNIDYDADPSRSTSPSSSSFGDLQTRSLDLSPLSNQTSFRVEGKYGEFDLICRSLGLSGPEDFAIPVAAWQARKDRSSFPLVSRSPLHRHRKSNNFELEKSSKAADVGLESNVVDQFEARVSIVGEDTHETGRTQVSKSLFSSRFDEDRFRASDEQKDSENVNINSKEGLSSNTAGVETKHEDQHIKSKDCLNSGGSEVVLRRNDYYQLENDCSDLNITSKLATVESCGRGRGIKGVRPPLLAPPPLRTLPIVDNVSSTWDLCRSFGPQDDREPCSLIFAKLADCSHEEDASPKRNERVSPKPADSSDEEDGSPKRNERVSLKLADSSDEEVKALKRNGSVIGEIVERGAYNGHRLGETVVISESCSYTTNGYKYSLRTKESVYNISSNWQKGELLGSGSFGTVYEGFTDDGFFFAVKEVSLLDQGSQGQQSIYQLEQEISLLSRFQHENIVQYLGTHKDGAKLYIFLELVTKGSLGSLYQKYHLRDSQVSAYTRQILNGLKYLHAQNVVHRDIKCANILVDATGSVKLADFGLAKATTLNDVKSCKGTAFWMAPEVVRSRGYGLAADIWSLGCTVLEMLTRRPPYSHLEGMQALYRIGKGEPPPVPDSLSTDARDFIAKCLQVNPNDRPTAAQLLEHPFIRKPQTSLSPRSPHHDGMQS